MQNKTQTCNVWDPLIRIFHWLLAASFLTAYILEDSRIKLHLLAGSLVLGLVAFRLIWGVVGTPYARFTDFFYPPREVLSHLAGLLRGQSAHYIGHTPAGSAMIFALLAGLLLLSLSGIALYGFQEGRGPLAALMSGISLDNGYLLESVHSLLADALITLVGLHVTGVIFESLLQRQNLTRAMITGHKALSTPTPATKEKQ